MCVSVCLCVSVCVSVCVCVHIYIHTHTHIPTQVAVTPFTQFGVTEHNSKGTSAGSKARQGFSHVTQEAAPFRFWEFPDGAGSTYAAPHAPLLLKAWDPDGHRLYQFAPLAVNGGAGESNRRLECFNGSRSGAYPQLGNLSHNTFRWPQPHAQWQHGSVATAADYQRCTSIFDGAPAPNRPPPCTLKKHCNPEPKALAHDSVAHGVMELGAHARANIAHARMSTGDGTEGSLFKFDFDFGAHPVAAELNTYGVADGIQDPSDNLKRRMSRSHLFGVDHPEATDTGTGDLRNKWCAGNRTHPPTRAQPGPHPYACLDHAGEPLAAYTGTLVFSQHVVSSGDLPFYDVDNLLRDSPYVASKAQWYVLPCVAQAAERCATSRFVCVCASGPRAEREASWAGHSRRRI